MLKIKISVYQGHSTHQIIIVIPFLPPVVDCLPLEKGFQKGGWVGGGGDQGQPRTFLATALIMLQVSLQ